MKKNFMASFVLSFFVFSLSAAENRISEDYLRKNFKVADKFVEESVIPQKSGGHTLQGLVQRLLGAALDRETEGMHVKRYIYKAYKKKQVQGLAHASSFLHKGQKHEVIVIYGDRGRIQSVNILGLNSGLNQRLTTYLDQFKGHLPEDIHYTYYRRRRKLRKRAGALLGRIKKPSASADRAYFNKILRSVRYNTAFMDVAYFITKHPEIDKRSKRVAIQETDV